MSSKNYINEFVEATRETFDSMCGMSFEIEGDMVTIDGDVVESENLMCVVGLSGDLKGAVMLSAPLDVSQKVVSAFLMEDIDSVNYDLMDGFGEIVNILAGAGISRIPKHKMYLALPSIIYGEHTMFFAKAGNPFQVVSCAIPEVGRFKIGVSLKVATT